jgi:adenine/guanine phosphoribosyltransferase-like PRPP-binding protein
MKLKSGLKIMKRHVIKSDYLGTIYEVNQFSRLVKKFATALKKFKTKNPFDAIAFTGTSGAAIAYPISALLKIPLICVRKGTNNHYKRPIEGCITADRYVIVDDFISMGSTMKKITRAIKKEMPRALPVAIFLYTSGSSVKEWNKIPVMFPNKR